MLKKMALQIIILFITFFTVISDAPFRFFNSVTSNVNSTTSTVIVYSATGGGVVAAIAAARSGSSVTLIGATGGGGTGNHIGGMVTGGLQHTDCGNASVIGGITREFFIRVEKQYPNRSTDPGLQPCTGPPCWLFEAHVAERVMYEMLEEANVDVITGQEGIANVTLIDKRVTLLTTLTGRTFKADVFIDASYEGDLLAAAGATMTFGRESKDQYDEKGAGVQPIIEYDQLPSGINPFWSNGEALPLITTTKPFLPVGSADDNLESYSYRLCMTRSPSRRIPITQPLNYNSSTFELFRRIFAASPSVSRNTFLVCLGPIPSLNTSDCPNDKSTRWCKCDMISGGALGTDLVGGSYGYANASVENRRLIAQAHADYVAGVIWFLTHDTSVPVSIRKDMADYGLCADEFLDTTPKFFPHQLYVREARRLVGDFVLTQNRPLPLFENRSIGLGSYAFDAHTVQRGIRINNKGNAEAINEGEIVSQPPAYQASYRIPYDTLLPSPSELLNVLAAVPVSASHVVFTSLRMEPTWMIIGHAAGTAASLAASECESNVHSVNVSSLQATLVASGQLIIE
jgi:hypothetical protein